MPKKKKKKIVKRKVSAKKTKKKSTLKKKSALKKKKPAKAAKKTASRSAVSRAKKVSSITPGTYQPLSNEKVLGEVEDYFSKIGVIALTLKDSLSLGDTIHVHGHTTEVTQKVESMQIDRVPIQVAKKGDSVGIKVNDKCRKGDRLFRVD